MHTNFDPGISELGNLPACLVSIAEFIGYVKQTEGTETSQYLQEKKSTEISKVVASEMEIV